MFPSRFIMFISNPVISATLSACAKKERATFPVFVVPELCFKFT